MIRSLLVALCFTLSFNLLTAGDKEVIDSLHLVLNNSTGINRVNVLNRLSEPKIDSDLEQAGHLAQVAVDVANEEDYPEGKAIAYKNLAIFFAKKNNGDSSTFAYLSALNYYESTNKLNEIASIYNSLGITLMNAGRYSESLDYLVKGLVLRQQLGNNIKIGGSYCNMGIVMEYLHEPKQALGYYLKSYEYLKGGENQRYLSNVLMNIGVVNFTLGNYRKSNEFYSEALVIQIQNDDRYGLMNLYMNLGNLSMKTKDLSAAIVYHNMSLTIAKELGDRKSISGTYINLGDVYSNKMGMHEKGLEYLEKGLKIAKTVHNKEWENTAYRAIAETHYITKNFEKAYLLEKQYATLNDSLVKANAKLQIVKSKAVLQMQRDKLQENYKKLAESDKGQVTADNRLLIVVGCSGFLILVLLVLYLKEKRHL